MSFDLAVKHFSKYDRVLAEAAIGVGQMPEIVPLKPTEYFVDLCETIISQQLSTKVARIITDRLRKLLDEHGRTADKVFSIEDQKLRDLGISWSKVRYVKDLAGLSTAGRLPFEKFPTMSDEEITATLTQVKGIGPWTAEMFLIFSMGRPDVFSPGDLGLANGINKLYGEKKPNVKAWSPYRSYASRVLWRVLDGTSLNTPNLSPI